MRTIFSMRRPSRRAVRRIIKGALALGPGLLLSLAASGPAAAAGPITSSACSAVGTTVTCNLWAKSTGSLALPGGGTVAFWGFSAGATGASDAPSLPGPAIIVNEGDSVTVNLTNTLAVATALEFGGQSIGPGSVPLVPTSPASPPAASRRTRSSHRPPARTRTALA